MIVCEFHFQLGILNEQSMQVDVYTNHTMDWKYKKLNTLRNTCSNGLPQLSCSTVNTVQVCPHELPMSSLGLQDRRATVRSLHRLCHYPILHIESKIKKSSNPRRASSMTKIDSWLGYFFLLRNNNDDITCALFSY